MCQSDMCIQSSVHSSTSAATRTLIKVADKRAVDHRKTSQSSHHVTAWAGHQYDVVQGDICAESNRDQDNTELS